MVDPTCRNPSLPESPEGTTPLPGRSPMSLETFREVAAEVANKFGRSVAICLRDPSEPGAASFPYRNRSLAEAKRSGQNIVEIVRPRALAAKKRAATATLHDEVLEVIATTPGGKAIDAYFGISSGKPEQSKAEAAESDGLIEDLRKESQTGGRGMPSLLGRISAHSDSSEIDAEALRALMRRGRTGRVAESSSEPTKREDKE